jgi:hypothetical protein
MRVSLTSAAPMRFADGSPVRAASGIATYAEGWLVVQDDATHGCVWRDGSGRPLRLLPPVDGLETFDEASGTKPLKPDLEAVVALPSGDALVLGSGSTDARMRSVLVSPSGVTAVASLAPTYAAVAAALGIAPHLLNLEGACVVDGVLRWFQRGLPSAGAPTASVDLPLDGVLAAVSGGPLHVPVVAARSYDLGEVAGVGLAVTDAVTMDDGRVLVAAAAEDAPSTYDDGPVVGSALAVLDGDRVADVVELPALDGGVAKVEGLAVVRHDGDRVDLVAVVDADDPGVPSLLLELAVELSVKG